MDSSFPPPESGNYRPLSGPNPGPVRVPLVIGLVALLLLVAIPLYLWRRPRAVSATNATAAAVLSADPMAAASAAAGAAREDPASRRVSLGEVHMVRCYAGRSRITGEQCDRLSPFEDSLVTAIRENTACAPRLSAGGTVSFVLSVDFPRRRTHLWAGRSGSIRKPRATELLRCVERAIPTPDWNMPHQFDRYDVNVIATYPPAGTLLPAVGMTIGGTPAGVATAGSVARPPARSR